MGVGTQYYNGGYVNDGLKQTGADIISLHCNDVI